MDAQDSNNPLFDDNLPPFLSKNESQMSEDSDCLSDSSRKIRKKRNAYQKISDDIRMKLLDAVKNGETLKSAAKRYKINYSSAKSILHTYRKEGRILKKSAQERTAKKKGSTPFEGEEEEETKPPKLSKRVSAQSAKTSQSRGSVHDGAKYETTSNQCSDDSSPLGAFAGLNDNFMSLLRVDSQAPTHEAEPSLQSQSSAPSTQDSRKTSFKEREPCTKENKEQAPVDATSKLSSKEEVPNQKIRIFGDLIENNPDVPVAGTGTHEVPNYMNFYNEFDSMNDMAPWNLRKFSLSEDFCQDPSALLNSKAFNFDEKLHKFDFGPNNDEHKPDPNCPLKSFMDTQNLFRQALRKASIASFSGSIPGFRKNSMDLFF